MAKKERYEVTIDRKGTIWVREVWKIEAASEEDAERKVREMMNDYDELNQNAELANNEYLFETFEEITPRENCAMAKADNIECSGEELKAFGSQTVEIIEELTGKALW